MDMYDGRRRRQPPDEPMGTVYHPPMGSHPTAPSPQRSYGPTPLPMTRDPAPGPGGYYGGPPPWPVGKSAQPQHGSYPAGFGDNPDLMYEWWVSAKADLAALNERARVTIWIMVALLVVVVVVAATGVALGAVGVVMSSNNAQSIEDLEGASGAMARSVSGDSALVRQNHLKLTNMRDVSLTGGNVSDGDTIIWDSAEGAFVTMPDALISQTLGDHVDTEFVDPLLTGDIPVFDAAQGVWTNRQVRMDQMGDVDFGRHIEDGAHPTWDNVAHMWYDEPPPMEAAFRYCPDGAGGQIGGHKPGEWVPIQPPSTHGEGRWRPTALYAVGGMTTDQGSMAFKVPARRNGSFEFVATLTLLFRQHQGFPPPVPTAIMPLSVGFLVGADKHPPDGAFPIQAYNEVATRTHPRPMVDSHTVRSVRFVTAGQVIRLAAMVPALMRPEDVLRVQCVHMTARQIVGA